MEMSTTIGVTYAREGLKVYNFTYHLGLYSKAIFVNILQTSRELQNAAQRTYHRLSRCQVVLTKRPFEFFFY